MAKWLWSKYSQLFNFFIGKIHGYLVIKVELKKDWQAIRQSKKLLKHFGIYNVYKQCNNTNRKECSPIIEKLVFKLGYF